MDGVFNSSLIATASTAFGTTSAAFITGYVTLQVARRKEKTEVQVTINEGFKTLISELQKERTMLMETIQRQAEEITRLRGEIRQSQQKVDSLERFVTEHRLLADDIVPLSDRPRTLSRSAAVPKKRRSD